MEHETLIEKLKSIISSIGWKLFIWGSGNTEEEYWNTIYEQEKSFRQFNQTEL